jgi:alcohol dehydrogenase (cytochrome c)
MRANRLSLATATVTVTALVALGAAQRPAPPAPPAPPLPMPAILKGYPAVTAERLLTPSDGEWLMIRRTYDGWGYSPLDQITPANVARLQPVWVFSTGAVNGHEAPPLVNGGVMFVSTPGNQVIAVEAKTGRFLWRYRRPLPEDAVVMHPTSRGVALYGDKVYLPANEGVLVALDARTGRSVDGRRRRTSAALPDAGPAGGRRSRHDWRLGREFGIRGFVAASTREREACLEDLRCPRPGPAAGHVADR